jgi:hypothetical protein
MATVHPSSILRVEEYATEASRLQNHGDGAHQLTR